MYGTTMLYQNGFVEKSDRKYIRWMYRLFFLYFIIKDLAKKKTYVFRHNPSIIQIAL